MSIDPQALSRQFHEIHKDIYADMGAQRVAAEAVGESWLTDEREALRNLASAVSLAGALADAVTTMRMRLRCGCGAMAVGRDMLGGPICAACRTFESAAIEDLAAVEAAEQGAWDDPAVQRVASETAKAILGSLPTQPKASDR